MTFHSLWIQPLNNVFWMKVIPYRIRLTSGVDELLANHIAHLFIRAPLVIFNETINQNDLVDSDHFENLQSTNWQHMRFKPPPPGSNIGWRVEFRSMEIQITDFENAAFAVFIVLVTRVILSYGLDFYIPISKVEEGMDRAHTRDAVLNQKFWFRRNVFPPRREGSRPGTPKGSRPTSRAEYEEMTINEIINGQIGPGGFPGLVRLVEKYLDGMNVDITTRCEIGKYLSLVSQRASGTFLIYVDRPQENYGPLRSGFDILSEVIQTINMTLRCRSMSITILCVRLKELRRD